MKGRKPKLGDLKIRLGNPGRRPVAVEPVGDEIGGPPPWLDVVAREEWLRVVSIPGVALRAPDVASFAAYCMAVSLLKQAAQEVTAGGVVAQDSKGNWRRRPATTVLKDAAALILRAASELGLSPTARARVPKDADEADAEFFA